MSDVMKALENTRQVRRLMDDTLALAELYHKDSREFPFNDKVFSTVADQVMSLQIAYLAICAEYAHHARASMYDDMYIVLKQLVKGVEELKPLLPTHTSWQSTQQCLTRLYFFLLVLTQLPTSTLQGGGAHESSLENVLKMARIEDDPELWDDIKVLRFGHAGETLMIYEARTKPMSVALSNVMELLQKGTPSLGLNAATLHPLDEYPSGTTVLHVLARRYRERPLDAVELEMFLSTVGALQRNGADARLNDGDQQSFASLIPIFRGNV
jgi:hypothetical protein